MTKNFNKITLCSITISHTMRKQNQKKIMSDGAQQLFEIDVKL